MSDTTIYPEGIRVFKPNNNAPDFVKGTVILSLQELRQWIKSNEQLLTEYNGKKQLKLQLLEGNKGLYFKVDTFRPTNNDGLPPSDIGGQNNSNNSDDDLPF